MVLDWTCRIRIAFPVLRDFNQPVPLLGIQFWRIYTLSLAKRLMKAPLGTVLGESVGKLKAFL